MKDGQPLSSPVLKDENTKPYFYCPYHKDKHQGVHFPFSPDEIEPCKIKYCFCRNICGWIAHCKICDRIIHNCIHGCKKGLTVIGRSENGDALITHYDYYHQYQPVYLYY